MHEPVSLLQQMLQRVTAEMDLKKFARDLFLTSIRAVHVDEVMRQYISREDRVIYIREQALRVEEFADVFVVAIGKAGDVMLTNLLKVLKPAVRSDQNLQAILVSSNSLPPNESIQQFLGDHPFPRENSAQAARAILELLETTSDRSLVFFLISGGASSMVEASLHPHWTLDDVESFYRGLVHSGLPIAMMNTLRKHASRTKGGRMAVAASPAKQCTLLVSDVPDDRLDLIGSGPSLPDPSTIADCRNILTEYAEKLQMPAHISDWFFRRDIPETPKPDHPAFHRSSQHVLLSNHELVENARAQALAQGFFVAVDNSCDDWDYRDAASYLLTKLQELRQEHDAVCLLSGGELSVEISSSYGIGGRNQQFALECARLLAERSIKANILSAGSDGIDGNSVAAGAIADETTFSRAAAKGIDPLSVLEDFNSYDLFKELGDEIVTGPTGNNLRDLRILLSSKVL